MSEPNSITATFLDRILSLLAPLFLAATGGDIGAAREAADSMLANYNATTDDELRLVALSVAFGFGALDALGRATANPDLSLNQILRLRNNATALNRAGHQNDAVLDKRRKLASSEPAPEPEPAQPSISTLAAPASPVAFARSVMPARPHAPAPAVPLSRQQRRAAEREAEKIRQRRDYETRHDARANDMAVKQQAAPPSETPDVAVDQSS